MSKSVKPFRRHIYIPDTQVRPGVPIDHIDWIAQAIVDYRPDVVCHLGDHWDFPSLNRHAQPGSEPLEGARFSKDVEAGNRAFARLCKPMEAEIRRTAKHKNPWNPRREFVEGNHEDRANRAAVADPKWLGTVGTQHCDVRGWKWNRYLQRVWIDGICVSHFFQSSHSKFAIGGSVDNRLNKIGSSFVQGHEQGFRYGNRMTGSGRMWHGVVAGSAYLHEEEYRGAQGQRHWRGIIVANEVRQGDFSIMPLTLSYLCWRYEKTELVPYMKKKYPDGNWDHLKVED